MLRTGDLLDGFFLCFRTQSQKSNSGVLPYRRQHREEAIVPGWSDIVHLFFSYRDHGDLLIGKAASGRPCVKQPPRSCEATKLAQIKPENRPELRGAGRYV